MGVFSSWLTFATKSRRIDSMRCISVTSSITAIAPIVSSSWTRGAACTVNVRRGGPYKSSTRSFG